MIDPVERLIRAWVDWEDRPGSRAATVEKAAAIEALGLDGITAHRHIADWRRRGYSIPDAVQALVNESHQEAN